MEEYTTVAAARIYSGGSGHDVPTSEEYRVLVRFQGQRTLIKGVPSHIAALIAIQAAAGRPFTIRFAGRAPGEKDPAVPPLSQVIWVATYTGLELTSGYV